MDLLTTSAQRAYRTCPRLYLLRYEQGYRPAFTSDALAFGTLGHRGLEAWWGAAMGDAAADAVPLDAMWLAASQALDSETDPYQRARAQALMWGYHAKWGDLTWKGEPITVLAVEAEFRGALVNPMTGAASKTWHFAGKLDAVIEVDNGRQFVVEHKTTSEDIAPGADYWQRLQIDPQITNYLEGARMLGFDPVGVIYDVIKKTSLKPAKATPVEARKYTKATAKEPSRLYAGQRETDEAPADYYQRLLDSMGDLSASFVRALVVRLPREEIEGAADLWQTGVQIRDARRLRVWPRNPDACMRYGRRCEFFEVCTGAASLDDPTRYRRSDVAHEELQMGRAAAAE